MIRFYVAECIRSGLSSVKNVPVNYAMWVSGPVTALTARRVRYGVAPDLICQPDPPPGIKTHSAPAAFPTTLLAFFCPLPPLTFLHRPSRASGRAELHLLPYQARVPRRTDTTRLVGKISLRDG